MSQAVAQPDKVKALAKNLATDPPRSPREKLAGYIIAARAIDKCRAVLAGTQGGYHSGCPLDNMWLDFAGIAYEDFKAKVAEGATDEELATWIEAHAKKQERITLIKWNNQLLGSRLCDMPDKIQEYMEDYVAQYVPKGKIVYHFFDIYDYEEGRL
jgi:Domain of unknown function (DUF5069)